MNPTNEARKVLILDGSSFIGGHLYKALGSRSEATYYRNSIPNGTYFDARTMDLSDVITQPRDFSHAVVLFAIPNPDACARDVEGSYELNVGCIKRVINYLEDWKIKPVFTSTESVFDGLKGNYLESDQTNPVLTYGKQKVEIEEYLSERCSNYTVVRLSKVFGLESGDGTLFTDWLQQIKNRETIYCATDQIFSPICVADVVKGIIGLIDMDGEGIFHLGATQAYSRLELLNMLLSELPDHISNSVSVVPCSIHDFELPEKRPLDISLNPARMVELTGLKLQSVQESVRLVVLNT